MGISMLLTDINTTVEHLMNKKIISGSRMSIDCQEYPFVSQGFTSGNNTKILGVWHVTMSYIIALWL